MSVLIRLKKLRKILGLTQEQFALKIGLKKGSYANIESGNDPLVDRTINAIALAFPNVNSDYLIFGRGLPLKSGEELVRSVEPQNVSSLKKCRIVDSKQDDRNVVENTELVKVLRELLRAKDQIIAEKERQVQLLEMLLARK